ncbi:class II lanthipeptide, LchA2/BrtA2 family [Bacillus thuringiensis]|uniref:Class II lanthipeptide, LchA2/BrtA2 family n=2 Tax=Bacillus TaxID=1386 RepID=A0AAW9GFF5_BACTU|nr:class II lanthipeptide, LchA2/BrtA2 family [Bacillus thuringiensis]MDY0853984.1 class II lanthipeptide, LchA2/BrtA2 family [Bacillus thuringiensis]
MLKEMFILNLQKKLTKKQLREQFNFDESIGKVDEAELVELSGASGEVTPYTTWGCAIFTIASAAQCPTTACSSKCL